MTYAPAELPPTEAVRTAIRKGQADVFVSSDAIEDLRRCLGWCLVRDAHEAIDAAKFEAEKAAFAAEWADYPVTFIQDDVEYRKGNDCWYVSGPFGMAMGVPDNTIREKYAAKAGATVLSTVQG